MNTLPGIGDNTQSIDFAADETSRLKRDYAELETSVVDLIAKAEAIELPITDNETKGLVASTLKTLRDTATRVEGLREIEKTPHLRRGNAVDQWFGRLRIAIRRDNKKDRPAIGDTLQGALTDYDNKLLAQEQERRRLEALRLQREADERRRKEQEAAAAAEAARLAAERARKPETQAAKEAVADQAEVVASVATVETKLADQRAEVAYVDTLARPADIMRQRGDDGVLMTMGTVRFAEITDRSKLDLTKLAPFIAIDALEKALRSYAASNGYSADPTVQIAGAVFGTRAKSVVR